MKVQGEGLAEEDGTGLERTERTIYVVHPNCSTDDL